MHSKIPKLAAYSTAAFAFLSLSQVNAQCNSFDYTPDLEFKLLDYTVDNLSLDVDIDGEADTKIHWMHTTWPGSYSATFTDTSFSYAGNLQFAQTVKTFGGYYTPVCSTSIYIPPFTLDVPATLPAGVPITASLNWGIGSGELDRVFHSSSDSVFLAFRLPRVADTLYGWLRVKYELGTLHFYDLAFSSDLSSPLLTGDSVACIPLVAPSLSQATGIVAVDVGDCTDGSSRLSISYVHPSPSHVLEHRCVIVPDADAAGFSLTDAQALSPSQYTIVDPSDPTFEADVAINGALALFEPYRIFIHSIGLGYLGAQETLSAMSDAVVPMNPTPLLPVTNLVSYDDGQADVFAGENLRVTFEPVSEDCVSEYFVFAEDPTSGFDCASQCTDYSFLVSTPFFDRHRVPADGSSSYEFAFSSKNTITGIPIAYGQTYNIHVVAVSENLQELVVTSVYGQTLIEPVGTGLENLAAPKQLNYVGKALESAVAGELLVFAVDGRKVFQGQVQAGAQTLLPIESTGIYFAQLETPAAIYRLKFWVD